MSQLKSHCSLNWHQQQRRVGNEGLVILPTSVSQSASAFCLRLISTSTWLRACFSLTSKAPLSVSVFLSISLHDPSSCSVFSHLRRQSSKFCAIWIKSRGENGSISIVYRGLKCLCELTEGKDNRTCSHDILTGFNVLTEKVNLRPHPFI